MNTLKEALQSMKAPTLTEEQQEALREGARKGRIQGVLMTAAAGSGHPAGSLSSMELYLLAYGAARINPQNPDDPDRDRVVVSHGHTSPGAYAALAFWGFVSEQDLVPHFRQAGSPFQGHVEREVPGIDWGTGNLGQGLAAGVGFALAARARGSEAWTYVLMGDGEQVKGQVAEARRIAAKERLNRLTVLVDLNHIQICGTTEAIMPADLVALWQADGWRVAEVDGHDVEALYVALREAREGDRPTVLLCRTVMGKGVSFMEGIPDYHGKVASGDRLLQALEELGASEAEAARVVKLRDAPLPRGREVRPPVPRLDAGSPLTYGAETKTDNRSAFGKALADLGARNRGVAGRTPLLVFDCDLAGSVKVDGFAAACPEGFVEAGIQEHAVATAAGAASTAGVVSVWADFGVFGLDEAYNQQRLNDINGSSLKLVLTHVGLDVGEDGKTHQCIDYAGLLRNTFDWRLVVPADPNQTDRAVRWALTEPGNVCLAMGRSVVPPILREDGTPFFGDGYAFRYGEVDVLRPGRDGSLLALGALAGRALEARDLLAREGLEVQVLHTACPLGLDPEELLPLLGTGPLVTVEDHHVDTGLGASVALILARSGRVVPLRTLGVTRYGDSGASRDVYRRMGLDAPGIRDAFLSLRASHA
mgnify:CR=1 FL=1